MKIRQIVAAVVASLSCALCMASCVQPPQEAEEDIASDGTTSGQDEAVDEGGEAITSALGIHCHRKEIGAECMIRCALAGFVCPGGKVHPYKSGGTGYLFSCGPKHCAFYYEANGDKCWFFSTMQIPLCKYEGEFP